MITAENALNLVAGVVLTGLGLVVLAARRRHPPALAFGVFALGGGGFYLFDALLLDLDFWAAPFLWAALVLAWGLGAFWLFVVFPVRLHRAEWRDAALAVTIGLALAVLFGLAYGKSLLEHWLGPDRSPTLLASLFGLFLLVNSAFAACMLGFPLRVRRLPADAEGTARSIGTMAVGFCLFGAATLHEVVDAARGDLPSVVLFADGGFVVLPVVFWLFSTRGPHSKVARNVILASSAIYLGSLGLAMTESAGLAYPGFRTFGALVLAYAVLRGQIEGLDLKVRFAIKTSTVAAVFLAVLFIVANIAQNYFGGQYGVVVGGAAAGMLFFVMAPIQRMAERLAVKAVPSAPVAGVAPSRKEQTYRDALAVALRDRKLTPAEEVTLARLAEDLGIGAGRAMELRHEAGGKKGRDH